MLSLLFLCLTGLASRALAQAALLDMAPAHPQQFQQDDGMSAAGDVNPALYYWQAIAAYEAAPAVARTQWEEFSKQHPTSAEAMSREQVAVVFQGNAFDKALALARKAAAQSCTPDWGVDFARGFSAELPHLHEIRALMRLLLCHARYQQLCGNTDEAMADLTDVFRTERQLTRQGKFMLIELLVQKAIERQGIGVTALLLPQFTPAQACQLSTELASLPPGGTFAQAMLLEKRLMVQAVAQLTQQCAAVAFHPEQRGQLTRLFREMTGDAKASWLLDYLADPAWVPALEKRYDILRAVLALPTNRIPGALRDMEHQFQQEQLQTTTQMELLFDTLPLIADREHFFAEGMSWARKNNPAFAQKVETLVKQTNGTATVLWASVSPAWLNAYQRVAQTDAEWALLRAGLLVQAKGAEVLPDIADPFTPHPYVMQKAAKGFRLTSALRLANTPVSLYFGDE